MESEITRSVRRLSAAYRDAEKRLGMAATCIIGPMHRQRRKWDDNEGCMPTRLVVTTGNPLHAGREYNRGVHSPDQIYHLQAHVWWQTRAHAEQVKDWLEARVKPDPLLNGWWDVDAWMWEVMFGEAAKALKYEAWGDEARDLRIESEARKPARRR